MSVLIEKLKAGGEKAVVGITGYYPMSGYDHKRYCLKKQQNLDGATYIKVKVVGVELGGRRQCGTQFVVEPVGGFGAFILEDACQFYASKDDIRKIEAAEKAREEKWEFQKSLGSPDMSIAVRREKLNTVVLSLPAKDKKVLAAECQEMKTSLDDPDNWKHSHCARLATLIMGLKYPKDDDDE